MTIEHPQELLRDLLTAAISVARPSECLPAALDTLSLTPSGRVIVLGAGKAAAAMAQVVEQHWDGQEIDGGVVTRYGYGVPCRVIDVLEAAHPVPDPAGQAAAERLLSIAASAGPGDLIVFLMSGGASALLSAPVSPLTLEDKQQVTRKLLAVGADIHEVNAVRKHLSAIKGGRLAAAAHPARIVTLAISDVVGDDPATIGSGPTVADPSTLADARAVIDRYGLQVPEAVTAALLDPANETIKTGDPRLEHAAYHVIAAPRQSLEAAADKAHKAGVAVEMLGDDLTGEARNVGAEHAASVLDRLTSPSVTGPRLLLSGGELTVTMTGSGKGGPNTEYLLAMAAGLKGAAGVWALAADTDGADGSEDNAGAIITPDTLARATALGLQPSAFLADNDAWSFFNALGDLVVTGPTHTNVNDFRAILIS